jgi:molybdate-binding protein
MRDLEIKGIAVRVTKYKVMIYDEHDKITEKEAAVIALYLRDEGFIKKDEFPIEIIKPNE